MFSLFDIENVKQKENIMNKIKKNVSFFPYNFIILEGAELELYNSNLKLFEFKMLQLYPFGNDSFTIDHGKNYFAFFKRLGIVNYLIIQNVNNKTIVGTTCAILRKYISKNIENSEIPFWYFCDLKIDIEHRKQNLTLTLFKNMFYKFSNVSNHGYLISMDPNSQQIIHIFKDINKFFNSIKQSFIKLLIYSIKINNMKEIEKYFIEMFGNISYLSLVGKKDLILRSTNKSMEIYHLQHGLFSSIDDIKNINEIPETATIMFCIPKNSPLEKKLNDLNIFTNISATIISWSMDFFDWHNILTSDI